MKENEGKKELNEKDKEIARNTWDSWLNELEDKEQPDQCSIDNPDCEACGS
tara:strand:- start:377 stop:529 length:153 start_codon:yes stop_codon:yes gene_type:complete